MSKMSSQNLTMTAFQKFERNLPEENWWLTNATTYQPVPRLPNPPKDDLRPSRPCNIHLRCHIIQEKKKDFAQLNHRDHTLIMKIFIEENQHLMTRKTLLKSIPSSSTTQLYEPIEVIQFAMKKLTLPKITILQQLLDREIIFDA